MFELGWIDNRPQLSHNTNLNHEIIKLNLVEKITQVLGQ